MKIAPETSRVHRITFYCCRGMWVTTILLLPWYVGNYYFIEPSEQTYIPSSQSNISYRPKLYNCVRTVHQILDTVLTD
jgi:hypothetical protein